MRPFIQNSNAFDYYDLFLGLCKDRIPIIRPSNAHEPSVRPSSAEFHSVIKRFVSTDKDRVALHISPNQTEKTKMSEDWELKVCCMGAGYVGGPTMAVIAKQCPKVRLFRRRTRDILTVRL